MGGVYVLAADLRTAVGYRSFVREPVFHAALGAFELVLLVAAARKPGVFAMLGVIAASAVSGSMAAVVLGEDAFGIMRFGALALFLHGPLLLLASAILLRRRKAVAAAAAVLAVALAATGFVARYVEPFRLEVNVVRVAAPGLDRPYRIAVLADFQTDAFGPYERRVAAALADVKADLILLPGDYLQVHDWPREQALRESFRALFTEFPLTAPLGAFAVRGDCEWRSDWREVFRGLPVKATEETTSVDVGPFRLTALSYPDSCDTKLVVPDAADGRFHIVFGHRPDFALGDVQGDLLLAGHTHGGQIRLPWIGPPITLSQVPRAWAAGRTDLPGGRTLYVSRGIGLERNFAPRIRFNCPPELVVIELVP